MAEVNRGSSEDFDRLVALAETLHDKCDFVRRRLELYRLIQVTILIFGVTAGVWIGFFSLNANRGLLLALAATAALIYLAMIEILRQRLRRRTYPDRAALKNILSLVRETEAAISRSERWSALDRAQLQIRLSRLELEP